MGRFLSLSCVAVFLAAIACGENVVDDAAGPVVREVTSLFAWQSTHVWATNGAGRFVVETAGPSAEIVTLERNGVESRIKHEFRAIGVSPTAGKLLGLNHEGVVLYDLPSLGFRRRVKWDAPLDVNWILPTGKGLQFAAVGYDGRLRILTQSTPASVRSVATSVDPVHAVALDSHRGTMAIVGTLRESTRPSDGKRTWTHAIEVINLPEFGSICAAKVECAGALGGSLAAARGNVWIPTANGDILTFQVAAGRILHRRQIRPGAHVRVALSADGNAVVALAQWGQGERELHVFDVSSGGLEEVRRIRLERAEFSGGVAICPHTRSIVLTGHKTLWVEY